jgi:hypothetical protein
VAVSLLLLGGWVGMHAGDVILTWRADGPAAVLASPAAGPLELLALWLALEALWRGGATCRRGLAWPAAWVFAFGLLLPASLPPALLLIGFGAALARENRGAARWGAIGMAGLGLNLLWLRFGQAAVGNPVIAAEAWATKAMVGWLDPGILREGPLLRRPDGHGVVILPGCSVAQTLPVALLSFLLLRHADGVRQAPLPGLVGMAGLLLALVATNLVRLGLLAWSPATYAWGHGALGANIFGLAGVVLIHVFAAARRVDA